MGDPWKEKSGFEMRFSLACSGPGANITSRRSRTRVCESSVAEAIEMLRCSAGGSPPTELEPSGEGVAPSRVLRRSVQEASHVPFAVRGVCAAPAGRASVVEGTRLERLFGVAKVSTESNDGEGAHPGRSSVR